MGALCPRFFIGVCVAAAPPVMCEARARRRRIAAATPSASCCKRAVFAAARAKIAAVLRRAGAVSICGAFARVVYVSGRGREQYAGCKSGEPECRGRDSRVVTFSSKRHARVEGSFFTGSWSPLGAVHREQGPLAAPVCVPSASVGVINQHATSPRLVHSY